MTAKIVKPYDHNFIVNTLIVKRSSVKKTVPDSNELIGIFFLLKQFFNCIKHQKMIRFIADVIKALLNKYDYIINQFLLYLFSSKCLYIFFKEKTLHLKLFFFIKFLIYIIDLSLKCHYTASVMFS